MQLLGGDTVFEVNRDATDVKALVTRQAKLVRELSDAAIKFEALFNQSVIFAGIMDLQGNLREANNLSVDRCGYTREQVLDRPFWDTPWWRGSDEMKAKIRFALIKLRDKSGAVMFLHPTGIDITERKRFEKALEQTADALRESEQRLGSLAQSSSPVMTQS